MTRAGDRPSPAIRCHAALSAVLLAFLLATLPFGRNETDAPQVSADAARLRLDPNVASAPELQLLPGIGPVMAGNIIDYRTTGRTQPAFQTLADLDAVSRIGPITLERLRPHLSFPAANRPPLEK